jgi:hypothetical protein
MDVKRELTPLNPNSNPLILNVQPIQSLGFSSEI